MTQPVQNLTVVSAAASTQKANIAIKAWVLMLKHALCANGGAFEMTAKWLDLEEWTADVMVHTEFDVGFADSDIGHLIKLYEAEVISRDALTVEMKRRSVLHDGYDPEKDLEKLDGGIGEGP